MKKLTIDWWEKRMGVYLVFYFLLLLWLLQAAISQVSYDYTYDAPSICHEKCGSVPIPFPFGIRDGCYNNSWFRVTCSKTAKGPKPFIARINLELLGSFWEDSVAVFNPVTYLNCSNKVNNGTTLPASVNLEGSPFFFSGRFNMFGSVGCGNLVTFFGNNQIDDPIGGCLQRRCVDPTSKSGGCLAYIPENLTSYAVTITEITNPEKQEYHKKCISAFMFDLNQLKIPAQVLRLSSDTTKDMLSLALLPTVTSSIIFNRTHVIASLEWNPFECDLGAALCKSFHDKGAAGPIFDNPASASPISQPSVCSERCGNFDISYPFGTRKECYWSEWFRVTCNQTGEDGPKPFISSIKMQILNVSISQGIVVVNNSVTFSNCRSKNEDNNGLSVNLAGSPFFFSHIFNRFVSVGCGHLVTILGNGPDHYPLGGCLQPLCSDNATSDISCLIKIPPNLTSFAANLTQIYHRNGNKTSCGSAFMVDASSLGLGIKISPYLNDMSSWTDAKTTLQWKDIPKSFPTTLQWGMAKAGLCELKDGSDTSCSSDNQYCWSKITSTHLCICSVNNDYDYATDVCTEIGKCENNKYRYCYMLCLNDPGNYCSSACPDRYERMLRGSRTWCENPRDFIAPKPANSRKFLIIIISCGTSIGTAFVLLGTWRMFKVLKRRKNIKLKRKYFKRNGGLLLQQQLSCNEGNVEKISLFASKELEKATDYYNENRILGQGGQGTVYKGMLTDGSLAAIKKSKMVEEKILDEKKLQQFINEVIILSQINHRNVVKLLGCCLETQVPLLVYELVPNGTLSQLIHDPNEEFPMKWEMRLRIAAESANALSYLHSAASVPIYHRDIKSSNILLDDKYRAKVSDFGTSISVALERTHVTTRVQGTFGYLDPEYFRSSQFTDKSDVYSFGVVLVELLTGQKAISSTQSEEMRSLVSFFLHSMKENSLFDILDPIVKKDGPEEEIIVVAKLAKRSLNLNGKKRPTMKQVAMELERIRASEGPNAIDQIVDEDSDADDVIEPSDIASCSILGQLRTIVLPYL